MTGSLEGESRFHYIRRNNGHLSIVSEAIIGSFAGEIRTKEDVRQFVADFEADIKKGLKPSEDSEREARERAGSIVGQTLGLNKDHPRTYLWLDALRGAPQEAAVREAYLTFASLRTR